MSMRDLKERDIESYLKLRVESIGEVRKGQWIGRRGAPDRLVLIGGTTPWSCYVELKAPGKKPTKAQLREHARLRGYGLRVEVIDSLEGVDALLEGGP